MAKIKVLLTGACGRIGPYFVEAFRTHYDLRTFDIKPVDGDDVESVVGDIKDVDAVRAAMAGVDVVVHLAATSDEAPFLEQLVPNNVVGLYHVFESARAAGVRRIVYASTVQTVGFNPDRGVPIAIDEPPHSVSLYGATKILGEAMGRWYHDKHKMEFIGVRIGAFQPYDSAVLRTSRGFRSVWLSPRDAVGLFTRAIEKEGIGYGLVFGTSITSRERLDRRPMKDLLDFEPQDDVAAIPYEGNEA